MKYINQENRIFYMALLSSKIKDEISNRIKNGISINNISKDLNLGKSTIYYYYKKINGKKFVELQFIPKNSETEGEINGIFAGDGSQYYAAKRSSYQVNVHFGAKNYWYACYVKELFEKFFNKKFRLRWESKTQLRLRTESKKIFNYFQNYLSYDRHIKHCTVRLRNNCSFKFKIGFLRGMFDTDGCFKHVPEEKRTRIFYSTTSKTLAKQISVLLFKLDIQNSIYVRNREHINEKTIYVVNIPKPATHKFINAVKPMKALRAGSSAR